MTFLNEVLKEIDNEYASVAGNGITGGNVQFLNTGCYALNALLSGSIYGGLPSNKITAIAGEESVGKSFVGMNIIKQLLDDDPKSIVVFFESESAITEQFLDCRGIDKERVIFVPVSTVEQFRTQSTKILELYKKKKEGHKLFFMLDSLGMLSTNKEIKDIKESDTGPKDMTRPGLVRGAFRVLTLECGALNVPLLLTNHTYTSVGSFISQQEMAGGGGLKYAASSIIYLRKRKYKDTKKTLGNEIVASLKKGRFAKENSEVVLLLSYENGLDSYYGLQFIGMESGYIKASSTKSSPTTTYEFPNGNKGNWKEISKSPEQYFDEECMKMLESSVAKYFKYGSSDEEILVDEPSFSESSIDEPNNQEIKEGSVETKKRGRPKKK